MIYISIGMLVIGSIILLILYKYNKNQLLKLTKEELLEKNKIQLENELAAERKKYGDKVDEIYRSFDQTMRRIDQERQYEERSLVERKQAIEEIINELNLRKTELENNYQEQINLGKEHVEQVVAAHQELLMSQAASRVKEEEVNRRRKMEEGLAQFQKACSELQTLKQQELDEIIALIDDYKKKQEVINEEILRRRQVEEQQDFYRVLLSEQDKEDIHYLISIIGNIRNKQLLYKLIWSEYLQKPFNEMLKRVLEGKEVRCVIYKITNLKTGEIYIGKTKAEASKRWTEHIKTSLNIGTIARSKIHTMLFGHWDEFSFEILEKVSDESLLSSREKFYINFYQSNIYGYNMNSGG